MVSCLSFPSLNHSLGNSATTVLHYGCIIEGMNLISERVQHVLNNLPDNVTVADIAAACKISVQAVYKWRRGEISTIEPANLFRLADRTGFNPRWLATGEGPVKTIEDERMKRLADLYAQLDERGRSAVFRTAETECDYITPQHGKKDRAA